MVMSKANTVAEYLESLPEDRREVVASVRKVIRKSLPKGYKEVMNYGMIVYEVPLSRYPETYNKQPLCFAAVAAQKNHFAVYLNCFMSGTPREKALRDGFAKAGKKLDMGKSCIRFQKLDDSSLDAIAKAIAEVPADEYIAMYEASRKKK
jgi:uncharacterized protein YdhG (YjbR/CyaY superfamily)